MSEEARRPIWAAHRLHLVVGVCNCREAGFSSGNHHDDERVSDKVRVIRTWAFTSARRITSFCYFSAKHYLNVNCQVLYMKRHRLVGVKFSSVWHRLCFIYLSSSLLDFTFQTSHTRLVSSPCSPSHSNGSCLKSPLLCWRFLAAWLASPLHSKRSWVSAKAIFVVRNAANTPRVSFPRTMRAVCGGRGCMWQWP